MEVVVGPLRADYPFLRDGLDRHLFFVLPTTGSRSSYFHPPPHPILLGVFSPSPISSPHYVFALATPGTGQIHALALISVRSPIPII